MNSQVRGWLIRCTLIFLAGFILRIGIDLYKGSYNYEERSEIVGIAQSLATHGTFADAYGGSGPSAHASPLYPLLLSIIFRILGAGHTGLVAVAIFGTALASLQYSLVPLVAAAGRIPMQAGWLGGVLGALLPINFWVQTKGVFEYSLSGLLMVVVSALYLHILVSQDFRPRASVCLGVFCGFALLTIPPFILPLAALGVTGYYLTPSAKRGDFVWFALTHLAVAGAILLPWTIRNAYALGAPIWGRSNAGLELYLSNNDLAGATWDMSKANGVFQAMHPTSNDKERARVKALGEIAYNREKFQQAYIWIQAHPRQFAKLTLNRAFLFWFPDLYRTGQTIALAVVTLAGIAGFVLYLRTGAIAAPFFLILCLFTAAPLCFFQSSGRLRYPIEWIFYLFAAYLIYRASARWRSRLS